jgi:hypothetical protein
MGGLGNQMFQYAVGRRLSLERNVPLKLDIQWFDTQEKRRFLLDQFNMEISIASIAECDEIINFSKNRLLRKVYSLSQKKLPYWKRSHIQEQEVFTNDPNLDKFPSFCYLSGYWQSWKYLYPIRNILLDDFQGKQAYSTHDQNLIEEINHNNHAVCVHIRGGDYIREHEIIRIHYICTPDYYQGAIVNLRNIVGKSLELYIFTDDIDWVNNLDFLKTENYKIISNTNRSDVQELILMSKFQNFIIPNSSFSWWAAWLSNHKNKKVIAPQRWHYNKNSPDLLPENWIKYHHNDKNDWLFIDIPYAKSRYKATFKKDLDLDNPKSFTEKIQWLKIYDRNPLYTQIADKYAVRDFVSKTIGEEFISDLIGVYKNVEEIYFENLPEKFVLKGTHGSNWNIFCKNKNKLDVTKTKKTLNSWLSQNYYYYGREWVYKDIPPKIICERLLIPNNSYFDYKFYCFHGNPKFVMVNVLNKSNKVIDKVFYDMDWNKHYFLYTGIKSLENKISNMSIPCPENFELMKSICSKLSKYIPFVRVDLYNLINSVIFGEMTLHPANGFGHFYPDEYDNYFGEMIDLNLV